MIHSVKVTNPSGESLLIDLRDPDSSGLAVVGITGLGPGTANVNMSEISTADGGIFNSARRSYRIITLQLSFEWKNSIEETRLMTYRFFPLKKQVTLLFETDNRKAEISGIVETNDPAIFSKSEGSDISIKCADPYFRSAGDNAITVTTFYGIEPMFEFPFENDHPTEPRLIMGNITQRTEAIIPYMGDSDTGLTIVIYAIGEVSNITVYNLDTRESMRLDDDKLIAMTGSRIHQGDEVTIRTDTGHKGVTLLRDGHRYNILNCLGPHPSWFKITKGDNRFAYTVDSGLLNMQFRMENNILYDGI